MLTNTEKKWLRFHDVFGHATHVATVGINLFSMVEV
jgi:hypothetical protein